MQVYKAFYKIIRKNLAVLMIYMVIFLIYGIVLTRVYSNSQNTSFKKTKINIARSPNKPCSASILEYSI